MADVIINFRTHRQIRDRFKQACLEQHCSQSMILNQMVQKFLAEHAQHQVLLTERHGPVGIVSSLDHYKDYNDW